MKVQSKSKLEKIINVLLNIFIVIFGIILIISIYTNVQTKLLGNNYSDFFGYSIFEVQTNSMADEINAGDWIVVDITKNVKLNDIITYRFDGEYITHRIIQTYKGTYITKGDANNSSDLPVDSSQIVGKVVKTFPNFGILKRTIFNPLVLIMLIVTLFIFNWTFKKNDKDNILNKLFKKIKDKKKQNIKIKEIKYEEPIQKEEEVIAKKIENITKEKVYDLTDIDTDEVEEELEKTSMYRVIPVDASEIDDTFLQIAEAEMLTDNKKKTNEKVETIVEVEKEENLTNINLELFESPRFSRGAKNLIDRVILIKEEEINEIVNVICDDKPLVNEATIKQIFTNVYIGVKYYNYYQNYLDNTNKMINKIDKILKDVSIELIKKYKGTDPKYNDKVNKYKEIFMLLATLDNANKTINDTKAIIDTYRKELTKYSKDMNWNSLTIKDKVTQINKIERNYIGIIGYFYKKLDTETFKLNCEQLITKKDIYACELDHNIAFNKIYSDYIIDKTYNAGVIAEDKIIILLTMLLVKISKDMINSKFNNKYLMFVTKSMYSKEKKFERILKMFDDEYAKDNILILLTYDILKTYKVRLKKYRKLGYRFALILDDNSGLGESNKGDIYIADYVFINKKCVDIEKIIKYLPEDYLDKIIYEDITTKISDLRSE